VSYRSDFEQFKESLREHGRFGLARQDTVATFSGEAVRDYQYDMVVRGWARATCRRRLMRLNRVGKWLVKRGHLNPLAEIEIPRREKRLPKVLSWSVAEQVVAGESRARNRAILAVLVYAGLRRGEGVRLNVGSLQREGDVALRVRGKGNKERVIEVPRQLVEALDAYLVTRPGTQPDEPMFLVNGDAASRPASSPRPWRGQDDGSRCTCTPASFAIRTPRVCMSSAWTCWRSRVSWDTSRWPRRRSTRE
jgi:site-specific recombinase XerD